ncbi:MAG TPA: hypothetical protein VNG13_05820 [Mycobacteriales bacterium]|nr:hypothetical protein [Mycobacteriales bacterium]
MGFLDVLLGRSKAAQPDLDQLFAVPSAAITLEAGTAFTPTGVGAVCFKSPEGGAFAGLRDEVEKLLALDSGKFDETADAFGFTWLVRHTQPVDVEALVTDLHAANSTIADAGFGPALLCTVVAFGDGSRKLGLVYLFKRGTWYPFAPTGPERRDNALELEIRAAIGTDLKVEEDLTRWFPVYGAPGL